MSYASLNDSRVIRAQVSIPRNGIWIADVWLSEPAELSGAVTLKIADLTLLGRVAWGSTHTRASAYRLEGAGAGWRTIVAAQHYRNDLGVKASKVLGDLATKVGESLVDAPTTVLGTSWVRARGPASRTLQAIVGRTGWYVASDGRTLVGSRPTGTVAANYDLISYDPERVSGTLATEQPGLVLPGLTVSRGLDEPLVITDLLVSLAPSKLRVQFWGAL
jgi:hypothetical protein